MAQQADRMRISEKKHIRERRPSNGSSADSGTGGFPVRFSRCLNFQGCPSSRTFSNIFYLA